LCSSSAPSIDEGWLRMFLALTNSGQSKTMCFIESGSLHWLQKGCSSCFMYVGEVGMTNYCSGIDNFGTSRGIGQSIPYSDFNLFVIGISTQDVCHILVVSILNIYTSIYVLVWKSSNGPGDCFVCQYIHFFISRDALIWGNPHEFDYLWA